jgi:hypothetical protein
MLNDEIASMERTDQGILSARTSPEANPAIIRGQDNRAGTNRSRPIVVSIGDCGQGDGSDEDCN